MRRNLLCAALLAALLLALLSGCAKGSAVEPALTVGGTEITGDTSVEDVLEALGDGYEYFEAISCVYEGMDKTYTYPDYILYTYPDGAIDHLMELYCTGGDVSAKGVTFGASKDEIVEAFGEDYTEEGSMMIYAVEPSDANNEPASVYFELTDGAVSAIALTAEHRSE